MNTAGRGLPFSGTETAEDSRTQRSAKAFSIVESTSMPCSRTICTGPIATGKTQQQRSATRRASDASIMMAYGWKRGAIIYSDGAMIRYTKLPRSGLRIRNEARVSKGNLPSFVVPPLRVWTRTMNGCIWVFVDVQLDGRDARIIIPPRSSGYSPRCVLSNDFERGVGQ